MIPQVKFILAFLLLIVLCYHSFASELKPVPVDEGCSHVVLCHKGYCTRPCNTAHSRNDWCYTTKESSVNYGKAICSHSGQCNKCWQCAERPRLDCKMCKMIEMETIK